MHIRPLWPIKLVVIGNQIIFNPKVVERLLLEDVREKLH